MKKLVKILKWDSNFFQFTVAQIIGSRINRDTINNIISFCKVNKVKLLQLKCDAKSNTSIMLAEKHKFHFVDTRMTFMNNLSTHKNVKYSANAPFIIFSICEENL